MFESTKDLLKFVREFSNLANPPYVEAYLDDNILDDFERKLGQALPAPFRDYLLLFNFDNLQFGTTMFGDGQSKFLDYVLSENNDFKEYLKIGSGEMGGIFISMDSGGVWAQYSEVWAQNIDGENITQTKLADDFKGFFEGYAYIQKNRMERILSLEDVAKIVTKKVGSDNYQVWLHSML